MQTYKNPSLAVLAVAAFATGCGGGGHTGGDPTPTGGIVRIGYAQPSQPLVNATVVFYDSAGNRLGTALVGKDGRIKGKGFPTAQRFTIDPSTTTVEGKFFNIFYYDGDYYTSASGCSAPLPSTGTVRLDADAVVLPNSDVAPPPAPTGCVAG